MGNCQEVRLPRFLKGHILAVNSVSWDSDQSCALSGANGGSLRLWDVETGHCLRVLEGHTSGVRSVAWSADHRYALSGADVSRCDFGTWKQVAVYEYSKAIKTQL